MDPSISISKKKRERPQEDIASPDGPGAGDATSASTTNFRNVSACNRCRNRKNRCDQRLPRCTGCEKANVKCVGFDPVSKRAIPRNYVYYLETRVEHLEALLQANNIPCPPPSDDFAIGDGNIHNVPFPPLQDSGKVHRADTGDGTPALDPALQQHDDERKLDQLASNVGMVSVQGASDPRQATRTSGIPFSKVVYAAVKSSVSQTPSEKAASKPAKQLPSSTASGGGGSDSFFGLNSKPTVKAAPFPEQNIGLRLCELYFEHANPQIPILHRGDFMSLVERVYATESRKRRPRELYLLNIVFAIGSGIIMGSSGVDDVDSGTALGTDDAPNRKRQRLSSQQHQPEEYHSAAIIHLDGFLGAAPAAEGAISGLEELQAVLLLAGLALLRPVSPGLWYIIGVAVRLAVDLGLHNEDMDAESDGRSPEHDQRMGSNGQSGRRQWVRDLRRRLWWCVYSFDRLVSTCVGRPFGVSDQVVTTEFPSLLDDRYITSGGFVQLPSDLEQPSYKLVAHHYFRLRLLQSEILQVLQHRQAEQARAVGANRNNPYMYTELPSPFMARFHTFREWRIDVDRRLWEWKETAPEQAVTGVAFTPLFLELNYWQAVILLYRQSLTVPEPLAGELSPSTGGEVQSPTASLEPKEDEEIVFMKVAQAGQTVLKIYRQLHRLKLVNYTFLATHHLFMSGISFLYAIWHSTLVRSQLTVDDVDFTVFIATSVLTDLIEKCPPALACRDAFARMSKATITMVMSTTGFGSISTLGSQPLNSPTGYFRGDGTRSTSSDNVILRTPKPRVANMPQFDTNLRDLFSAEELAGHPPAYQPSFRSLDDSKLVAPKLESEQSSYSGFSPQSNPGAMQYQLQPQSTSSTTYQTTSQQQYQPFTETLSQAPPDFPFDDLSFLDSFPAPDQNAFGAPGDLDLGFGTGGMGYDANGTSDTNGGLDLFDGFFFGGNGPSNF